jgi:AraC-like DNA-binding protein
LDRIHLSDFTCFSSRKSRGSPAEKWYDLAMEPDRSDFLNQIGNLREMLDALDRIPQALFMIKDLDSRYVYMSRALREAIHRRNDQDVVGKTDFDLFPRIIAQTFRDNDLLVLRDGRTLLNEIHATLFAQHAPTWSLSSKFPLRDRKGHIIGLITINEPYDRHAGSDDDLNRLLPAIEHLTKHYAKPFSLKTLAQACSYSPRHFSRLFRARLGHTAQQHLEKVRLFHALDAIRHTSQPIANIADSCGFYDHSSFVKRFKRFSGMTPLRCRKHQQDTLKSEPVIATPRTNASPQNITRTHR